MADTTGNTAVAASITHGDAIPTPLLLTRLKQHGECDIFRTLRTGPAGSTDGTGGGVTALQRPDREQRRTPAPCALPRPPSPRIIHMQDVFQ